MMNGEEVNLDRTKRNYSKKCDSYHIYSYVFFTAEMNLCSI